MPLSDYAENYDNEISKQFAQVFLEIINCPHRAECGKDFAKLDTSADPQGGFIGSKYEKRRILVMGQNPGGGKPTRAGLGSEDDLYYSMADSFKETGRQEEFVSLMNYLEKRFMPKWPLFRNFDLERNWGVGISDIALINAVHCRTTTDAKPNTKVADRCFREHTQRQINLLKPKIIICFGKQAYDFINRLYFEPIAPIKYVLHPSGQYTRQHPDEQMRLIHEIYSFLKGKRFQASHTGIKKVSTKHRIRNDNTLKTAKEGTKMPSSLKDYLIKLGAEEKDTKSFYESFDHPALGTINFIENGKSVGLNFLSSFMRNNCGYGTSQRKNLPYEKREQVYRKCLERKPYYKNIKEGLQFHFRASGTDYVSLSLGLGIEKLKNVIDHELRH